MQKPVIKTLLFLVGTVLAWTVTWAVFEAILALTPIFFPAASPEEGDAEERDPEVAPFAAPARVSYWGE